MSYNYKLDPFFQGSVIVEDCTSRELRFPSDKIPALSGICEPGPAGFFFGWGRIPCWALEISHATRLRMDSKEHEQAGQEE